MLPIWISFFECMSSSIFSYRSSACPAYSRKIPPSSVSSNFLVLRLISVTFSSFSSLRICFESALWLRLQTKPASVKFFTLQSSR